MHPAHVSAVLLFLALLPRAPGAVEMAATGISLPFFDDAGKLTHRLMAKRGILSGGIQKLQGVELHYVSPADPNVVVQKLEAADATWDEKKQNLAGTGSIVLATLENRITGEGFDFALETSVLHIHRDFTMTNNEARLSSTRATVELVIEKAGEDLKFREVKRCEAIDNLHITIQPAAQKRYPFKEAFSDLAVYDGATRMVSLPHPTRTVKLDGGEGRFNTFTFLLGDQTKNKPDESRDKAAPRR